MHGTSDTSAFSFPCSFYIDNFDASPEQFKPVFLLESTEPPKERMLPPPHDGYGTEEDSLANIKRLIPQRPKTDIAKFIAHDKKVF